QQTKKTGRTNEKKKSARYEIRNSIQDMISINKRDNFTQTGRPDGPLRPSRGRYFCGKKAAHSFRSPRIMLNYIQTDASKGGAA
ncbi:MAG: hypothetical protein AAGU77_13490, partial [Bacillota bacterium]